MLFKLAVTTFVLKADVATQICGPESFALALSDGNRLYLGPPAVIFADFRGTNLQFKSIYIATLCQRCVKKAAWPSALASCPVFGRRLITQQNALQRLLLSQPRQPQRIAFRLGLIADLRDSVNAQLVQVIQPLVQRLGQI